jgi:hypothetical protein
MGKITQWQVWIIGVVLAIISAVIIYFMLMKPVIENTQAQTAKAETDEAEAAKRPQYEKKLRDANATKAKAERDWRVYDQRYMPDVDVRDRIRAMKQLWQEQIKVLGPKVEKFLYADKKVRVAQASLQLAPPPTDPNTVATQKAITYDFGNITVVGTFKDIMAHVSRWNKFERLALADGLTLSGNSPNLTGTYNLRVFVFLHGTDNVGPEVPAAAAGQAGGFGGGGFGGPGGFSGPPGGFNTSSGPPPGFGGGGRGGPGADF